MSSLQALRQRPLPSLLPRLLPVAAVLAAVLLLWYVGAVGLNAQGAIERVLEPKGPYTAGQLIASTLSMERPVLPAPHQVLLDLWTNLTENDLDSPRNLLYHVAVTAQSTLVGFVLGTLLGVALAAAIVHSRTLDRALLPWIVASQTVPVLAIAPIVLVILGSLGFAGIAPKAAIAMYLCFFPVTVAMVQGLRSPQRIETELRSSIVEHEEPLHKDEKDVEPRPLGRVQVEAQPKVRDD